MRYIKPFFWTAVLTVVLGTVLGAVVGAVIGDIPAERIRGPARDPGGAALFWGFLAGIASLPLAAITGSIAFLIAWLMNKHDPPTSENKAG
jgi:hypothetical protein